MVNQCYLEYCLLANSYVELDNGPRIEIGANMNNIEIWSVVFRKLHIPFQYFMGILSDDDKGMSSIQLSSQKQIPVFVQAATFQEYIDQRINIQTIGPADYMEFTRSMKDQLFYDRMVNQYVKEGNENRIKNYLIYLVRLYLMQCVGSMEYLTTQECEDIDIGIDVIPFFEYLSGNGWSMNDLDQDIVMDMDDPDIKKIEWLCLERKTLRFMKQRLF